MEQKRKRSVLITVVSIIAISVSGFLILISAAAMLTWYGAMPAGTQGNDFQGMNDASVRIAAIFGVAGIAFLVASIGMLKRINFFRIAFVTLLGLAGAGVVVLGLESLFRFGLLPHSESRMLKNSPLLEMAVYIIPFAMCVGVVIAIVILIKAIMSKRASGDFGKPGLEREGTTDSTDRRRKG